MIDVNNMVDVSDMRSPIPEYVSSEFRLHPHQQDGFPLQISDGTDPHTVPERRTVTFVVLHNDLIKRRMRGRDWVGLG